MPPFQSAGNGTSTHAGYHLSNSSFITHTANNSFICMCCWYKFVVTCNSWGKNMLWLFGIVKNIMRKFSTQTLCTLSPVGSVLPWLATVNKGADKIGLCKVALFWRLPLIEKKAGLWYSDEKSCFCLLFPDLDTLCPIVTLVLLPIILSAETISEQFWCQLEKYMLYCSRKTPACKNGVIVEVWHVLLTLSPCVSQIVKKKIITNVYKNNDWIKFSTDFPL